MTLGKIDQRDLLLEIIVDFFTDQIQLINIHPLFKHVHLIDLFLDSFNSLALDLLQHL